MAWVVPFWEIVAGPHNFPAVDVSPLAEDLFDDRIFGERQVVVAWVGLEDNVITLAVSEPAKPARMRMRAMTLRKRRWRS